MIRVIRKRPGCLPEWVQVENTLEALQQEVGGYIETVTFARDACIICNEEGRLLGLPYNGTFVGVSFVGTILVVGVDGEEFSDLPAASWETLLSSFGGGANGHED